MNQRSVSLYYHHAVTWLNCCHSITVTKRDSTVLASVSCEHSWRTTGTVLTFCWHFHSYLYQHCRVEGYRNIWYKLWFNRASAHFLYRPWFENVCNPWTKNGKINLSRQWKHIGEVRGFRLGGGSREGRIHNPSLNEPAALFWSLCSTFLGTSG